MGTYLTLRLKNESERHIKTVNRIWNDENKGYEDTLHFRTNDDTKLDIVAIHNDPNQIHLRYIKTIEDWNRCLPVFAVGTFQVKITLGDYLCSEMARRYIGFIERSKDLFEELPDDYVMSILKEKASVNEIATECLVKCPFCNPIHKEV
ncbi:MAG: hypothetical protein Q8J68_07740 [Methanolobus sp.]|uniref:hypothetical protein n=1 Tax=Methanolobus sp. TaxID=1874737 RepID=UPI002730B41A|nr:hypothetical protein [Methanolobus sp.]MDP2217159.1 hypothetical protein [Methanolobus sp.]